MEIYWKKKKNGDGNSDSAEVIIARKTLLGSRRSLFQATDQLEIQTSLRDDTVRSWGSLL